MGAHTDDIGALRPQVEAVIRDSEGLVQALARARTTRWVLRLAVLLLLAVVLWEGWIVYSVTASWLAYDRGRALETVQTRLSKKSDQYMGEVQKLVEKTSPVLTEAFTAQAKKDMPGFLEAMEGQRDVLRDNLEKKVSEKLSDHYAQLLANHQEILSKEFPQVENKELHDKMVNNLKIAVENLVKKHYGDELQGEMITLFNSIDQFPPAPPVGKGDTPLEDQFVANLLQILTYKLTNTETFAQRSP